MKKKILMMALLAMPAAACSTVHVSTTEAAGAPQLAAGFHTYAWMPERANRDASHKDPFIEAQLKQAADRDLAAKGYQQVAASANPDFLVGWHVTSQQKTKVEDINPYWGYGWGPAFGPPYGYGGAYGPGTYVSVYQQGTLILDIVDAKSKQLVWRGAAQSDLGSNPSGEDVQKKVTESTNKILAKFPPQA